MKLLEIFAFLIMSTQVIGTLSVPFGKEQCQVDDFSVQSPFIMEQYLGTWYEIARNRNFGPYPSKQMSNYSLATSRAQGSGNEVLLMVISGISQNDVCLEGTVSLYGVAANDSNDEKAKISVKLEDKSANNPGPQEANYLLLYTDYDRVALVYNCLRKKPDGTCGKNDSLVWIMSRTIGITKKEQKRINEEISRVCVDPETVDHRPKDCLGLYDQAPSVESIKNTERFKPDSHQIVDESIVAQYPEPDKVQTNDNSSTSQSRQCQVTNFPMEFLNLNRFMGNWYEIARSSLVKFPLTNTSRFERLNGSDIVRIQVEGVRRKGRCGGVTVSGEAIISDSGAVWQTTVNWPGNTINDKLVVADTDYDNYAVMYSCSSLNPDQTCSANNSRVWVYSRKEYMREELFTKAALAVERLCVPAEHIIDTPPVFGCKCLVEEMKVAKNFVPSAFMGDWQEIGHLRGEGYMLMPDIQVTTFQNLPDGRLQLSFRKFRLRGICAPHNQTGKGWITPEEPAKFILAFPNIPKEYGNFHRVDYWIVDTDYDHYTVAYLCHKLNDDGTCASHKEMVWILGKEFTMNRNARRRVNKVIAGLCIDPSIVTDNGVPCGFDDKKHFDEWTELQRTQIKCKADGFRVMPHLDLHKFTGKWYNSAHTSTSDKVLGFKTIDFEFSQENRLYVKLNGLKNGASCIEGEVNAISSFQPEEAAKLTLQFPFTGFEESSFMFWIGHTDYSNYALIYSCGRQKSDGECDKDYQIAYILTRQERPSHHIIPMVEDQLYKYCIDVSHFHPFSETIDSCIKSHHVDSTKPPTLAPVSLEEKSSSTTPSPIDAQINDVKTSICNLDFECLNGGCLPVSWTCDGEQDCSDGSDEFHCDVPGAPTNVTLFNGRFKSVDVSWSVDVSAVVKHFLIQYSTSIFPDNWKTLAKIKGGLAAATVYLKYGLTYYFRVMAANGRGVSEASKVVGPYTTMYSRPDKNPANVAATEIPSDPPAVNITWRPLPYEDHGGPDLEYIVRWKVKGSENHEVEKVMHPRSWLVISNLKSTAYHIIVKSVNRMGQCRAQVNSISYDPKE